ncbi:MAG: DUF3473 domain-containing protein [Gammaproteobacteria bacterium]|nr:DUF3473 domain-containing protein [Gammaproteobacteria bacterium]
MQVINAFTVDVEDYFHVSAFERHIPRAAWAQQAQRVETSTDRVLAALEKRGTFGTFFTLGWVAERYPQLIRRIVAQGHELASHGYDHTRVTQMTPEVFRADITKTKRLLEDIAGTEVIGYRAPTFSFTKDNQWVYEILAEAGYRYSSSIAPVRHDLYGIPDAPRHAYQAPSGIMEVPISTVRIASHNLPCSGGGFFRLYPYRLTRWCFERLNVREGKPCIFYMHPWEIDPDQPRQRQLSFRTKFRHYLNLDRVAPRLDRLLKDFAWNRMDRIFLAA